MAYRIDNPDLTTKKFDQAIGIKLPLVGKSGNLFDQSYTTIDQTIANVKNLILTREGEVLYEPDLGTKLNSFLFENFELEIIQSEITDMISAKLMKWLPYVAISDLQVFEDLSNTNERILNIRLFIAVGSRVINDPITFTITSAGTLS